MLFLHGLRFMLHIIISAGGKLMYNENNMLNENERVNQPIDESAPVTEEPAAEPTTISDNAAQTHTG